MYFRVNLKFGTDEFATDLHSELRNILKTLNHVK